MLYDYLCSCGEEFTVVKPIAEYQEKEPCPKCGEMSSRQYKAPTIAVVSDFKADYYHSLGKVMTNRRELKYEIDKRGLEPVGNDFKSGADMFDHFEKKREYENKKKWEYFDIPV